MSILSQICEDKMRYVERMQSLIPQIVLEEKIRLAESPRGFINATRIKEKLIQPALITEIKKASPSRGMIRADFDPVRIARTYEGNGASCISVLTDEPYFKGRDEDLEAAKSVTRIPVLRKDFMLTEFQILESRALGADCILLIMAALEDAKAKALHALANDLGMDVLVEVHDEAELDRALTLSPHLIGVNARNLKTLEVDLDVTHRLHAQIPQNILSVAESGIQSQDDLKPLFELGYDAFLIGESLMRENDIGTALKKLLGN